VKWIKRNQKELNISKIIVQGESGGGNLTIATALKANQEGWIDVIDGVYACVPFISNAYQWERERLLQELPSLIENDSYLLELQSTALFAKAYDPEGKNATNPLAWPYHAEEKDLKGLPPFVVFVNELDPLRDEGIAFWRKLVKAGVKAVGRVNLGQSHHAGFLFRTALAEDYHALIGDINAFSTRL
jgi:acetyl esterase